MNDVCSKYMMTWIEMKGMEWTSFEESKWETYFWKTKSGHLVQHIVIYCLTIKKNNALILYYLLGEELEYPRHIEVKIALMNAIVLSLLQKRLSYSRNAKQ